MNDKSVSFTKQPISIKDLKPGDKFEATITGTVRPDTNKVGFQIELDGSEGWGNIIQSPQNTLKNLHILKPDLGPVEDMYYTHTTVKSGKARVLTVKDGIVYYLFRRAGDAFTVLLSSTTPTFKNKYDCSCPLSGWL